MAVLSARDVLNVHQMFLLHCFMNTPHFRLPVPVRRLLLWVMGECGVRDVPSLQAYQCLEEKLRKQCGVKTEAQKSEQGNIFYTNSITDLVCRVGSSETLTFINSLLTVAHRICPSPISHST